MFVYYILQIVADLIKQEDWCLTGRDAVKSGASTIVLMLEANKFTPKRLHASAKSLTATCQKRALCALTTEDLKYKSISEIYRICIRRGRFVSANGRFVHCVNEEYCSKG